MRTTWVLFCLLVALAAAPDAAGADEDQPVRVPDVRGMPMADAFRVLQQAGLSPGPVEGTSVDALERVLGRRFEVGTIVEQAPAVSGGAPVAMLPAGSRVPLRVAYRAAGNVYRSLSPGGAVPTAVQAAAPRQVPTLPTAPHAAASPTRVRDVSALGTHAFSTPPRPPPPPVPSTSLSARSSAPRPASVPTRAPVHMPSPIPTEAPPFPLPPASRTTAAVSRLVTPKASWFVRPVGGYAWRLGSDSGDPGLYAGVDLGHRAVSGWGIAAGYRWAEATFDRLQPGGWLEDGGGWHHVGLKAVFEKPPCNGRGFYFWSGLGAEYVMATDYEGDANGWGAFAELGVGYAVSERFRLLCGVNAHATRTAAARYDPADDDTERWIFTIAPVLGVELDF